MVRLLFNLVPEFMLAFSAEVLVIHAQPYDDAAVRALAGRMRFDWLYEFCSRTRFKFAKLASSCFLN